MGSSGGDDTEPARWNQQTKPATPSGAPRPSVKKLASPFDPPVRERFEEGAELGRGGMGRVFEARDTALDRAVAIKQSLTDDETMLVRFEREVRITAQLQHPGIVPVLDAGRDATGRPYYVMRKIEGRPLSTVVGEARTIRDRLALLPNMLAAVDAVAYAHARGVLHRDLKPWNILLGPFGETFVIDWGLARDIADTTADPAGPTSADDGLTRVGSAMGTPGFMAPEQARGEPIDYRADVYALGATLVYVLAGAQPFAGVSATLAIERVSRNEMPAVAFPDEVPAELITIATKAMMPDRDARYADSGELASDLRRFLAGQLVAAHAYTVRERVVRWLRKHRLAVAIAAIATVALVAISTYAIRRVVIARDVAREAQARAADRADAMLVERASALVTTDPAFALALLKQLPETSSAWARAHVVAQTAEAMGVGWGAPVTRPDGFAWVVSSPSGDVVAVTSDDELYLLDPSLQSKPRVIASTPGGFSSVIWFDNTALVAVIDNGHGLVRIARDGTQRPIQLGTTHPNITIDLLPPTEDGRLFVRYDSHLLQLDPNGGPPLADLGKTRAAEREPGGLLYQIEDKLIVHLDGKPPMTVAGSFALDQYRVATNLALGRIALFNNTDVIELGLTNGAWTQRGHWQLTATAVLYRGERLIAIESGGFAYLWPNMAPWRDAVAITRNGALVAGGAFVSDEGVFVAGDRAIFALITDGVAVIAPFSDPLYSMTKAGHYLVALSRTGTVRSWDLRRFLPRIFPIHVGAQAVAVDARQAWFFDRQQVLGVDLGSGTIGPRIGGDTYDETMFLCDSADHRAIIRLDASRRDALKQPALLGVADRDGHLTPVPGTYFDTVCQRDAPWLGLMLQQGVELRDRMTPERPGKVYATAAPIRWFAMNHDWLAMVDSRGELTRVNIATGEMTRLAIGTAATMFAIDPRGRVATLDNAGVSVWSDDGTSKLVVRDVAVYTVAAHDVGFLVFTRDHSLVTIDPDNQIKRLDIGEVALSIASEAPISVVILDGKVAILDMRDGSMIRLPWPARSATIAYDGKSLAWTALGGERGCVYQLTVPREPKALRRWLDTATNATLAPGSTQLSWK